MPFMPNNNYPAAAKSEQFRSHIGGPDDLLVSNNNDNDGSENAPPVSGNSSNAAAGAAEELSLEPYFGKLESFELFSTNQCYYLVGSDRLNTAYRVLKMDRTRIERPPDAVSSSLSLSSSSSAQQQQQQQQQSHHHQHTSNSNNNNPAAATAARTTSARPQANNTAASSGVPSTESQQQQQQQQQKQSQQQQSQQQQQQQVAANMADNSHTAKPTLRPLSEFLTEDPTVYTHEEINEIIDRIHDGNRMARTDGSQVVVVSGSRSSGGGLKPIVRAYGVVGFIRFLDCYYLTLITRRNKVGNIGGNDIYTVKSTETIPLKPAERNNLGLDENIDPSSVLLSMWNRGKRSVGLGLSNREHAELRYQALYQVVDMTKNFYFSYTYDLTHSLQENILATTTKPFPPPPFKDMYAWNYFLTKELEGCLDPLTSYQWVVPLMHGAFVQRKVNDYGRSLNLILVARRSRHFAGTRYLKRGVSEQGKVANDVEHEQILHDESMGVSSGAFSSYLQVRGSIPIFWTQETNATVPKPPIELNRVDPTYSATQNHFQDLLKRYSSPVIVLDLVKQSEKKEREVIVGNDYRHAVDYINNTIDEDYRIRYCALDFSHISKHRHLDVSFSLTEVSTWAVNQTGFFCSAPKWKIVEGGTIEPFLGKDFQEASRMTEQLGVPIFPMEQNGVLRTNCIDCLDRTNVAQFSAGVEAAAQQLVVMGIRSKTKLDPSSNIVRVLIDMYVGIGDSIALQYGGSEALKKVSERSESNITGPIGKHKELLTSIRRYYSNSFTDRAKQDAMNLFLGYYKPFRDTKALWDYETDYHLHNFHVKSGRGTMHSMKTYRRAFGIDWHDDFNADKEARISTPKALPKQNGRVSFQRSIKLEESHRIERVRGRCQTQNDALSKWWKIALQWNIQQRMWMKLGQGDSESILLPRYERFYQPDKFTHFDKFFSRAWATPVRRSHSAQHSGGDGDAETSDFIRIISNVPSSKTSGDLNEDNEKTDQTLQDFLSTSGLNPHFKTYLKTYLEQYDSDLESDQQDVAYVGNLSTVDEKPCEAYLRYVSPTERDGPLALLRAEAIPEFTAYVHDYSLKSDDVEGIRELADSAHLCKTILSGPFRGLAQDESAIEVATTIQEQFNALDSVGRLSEGQRLVENELSRRGLDAAGVKESVATGWEGFMTAETRYSEIVHGSSETCRRSDLTTAGSLKLYASEYDPSTSISAADLIFLKGKKPADGSSSNPAAWLEDLAPRTNTFVEKAARLGIDVVSQSDITNAKSRPLFESGTMRRSVPVGFEQINDDMFARKDNKFMVFNGPGLDSWRGTQPITKTSHIENILLNTLK